MVFEQTALSGCSPLVLISQLIHLNQVQINGFAQAHNMLTQPEFEPQTFSLNAHSTNVPQLMNENNVIRR